MEESKTVTPRELASHAIHVAEFEEEIVILLKFHHIHIK